MQINRFDNIFENVIKLTHMDREWELQWEQGAGMDGGIGGRTGMGRLEENCWCCCSIAFGFAAFPTKESSAV